MSNKYQITVDREMLELLKVAASEKRDNTESFSLSQSGSFAAGLKEEVEKLDAFIHDVDVLIGPKPRRNPMVREHEKLKSTPA